METAVANHVRSTIDKNCQPTPPYFANLPQSGDDVIAVEGHAWVMPVSKQSTSPTPDTKPK
jgi:hypothetical protein